jgi:hypothetical protein
MNPDTVRLASFEDGSSPKQWDAGCHIFCDPFERKSDSELPVSLYAHPKQFSPLQVFRQSVKEGIAVGLEKTVQVRDAWDSSLARGISD